MLAGPASRAACITFDRPSAKSNSADVKAVTIGNSGDSPMISGLLPRRSRPICGFRRPRRRKRGSGLRPALLRAAPSTLAKPETTWPALAAMASASVALRTSRASVSAGRVGATRTSRLKPSAKLVTPHRFRNGPARGRNPQAAAGKLALQIRNHLARRRDHKPDQFVDRAHLAADRAHPHGRGPVGPRSIVEIGVSQSEHACQWRICASRKTVAEHLKPAGLRRPRPPRTAWRDRPR